MNEVRSKRRGAGVGWGWITVRIRFDNSGSSEIRTWQEVQRGYVCNEKEAIMIVMMSSS